MPTRHTCYVHVNTKGCSHVHGPMGNTLLSQATLLLYPDTPTKMETTSHMAFCHKPVPLPERGKLLHSALKLNGESAHSSTAPRTVPPTGQTAKSRATNTGQLRSGGSQNPEAEEFVVGNRNAKQEPDTEETMKSLYQKDFPPPLSQHLCRRRTPVHPQPDNIAINPSLRIDFSTVQRETYPGWPITKIGNRGRKSETSTRRANTSC
ncbi:unnamed protein product [Gadus morhua 'NCC']